jgi:hypothetical protein
MLNHGLQGYAKVLGWRPILQFKLHFDHRLRIQAHLDTWTLAPLGGETTQKLLLA